MKAFLPHTSTPSASVTLRSILYNVRFMGVGLFAMLLLTISSAPAHAIKPHRCNGRIQFTPCKDANASSQLGGHAPRARLNDVAIDPRFPIKGKRFAEVTSSSFTPLSRSTGLWSGTIRGNGLVETELVITRGGKTEVSRYMGHVWLQNKSTPFKITSALPRGKGWGWRIDVFAR